jgi:hypothetical protein
MSWLSWQPCLFRLCRRSGKIVYFLLLDPSLSISQDALFRTHTTRRKEGRKKEGLERGRRRRRLFYFPVKDGCEGRRYRVAQKSSSIKVADIVMIILSTAKVRWKHPV